MHILHVIDTLSPGGAQRALVEIANQAFTAGAAVSVCVTRRGCEMAAELRQGIAVVVLERKRRFDRAAMRRFSRWVWAANVDVIHAHGRTTFSFLAFLKTLGWIRPPLVMHDHTGKAQPEAGAPLWFRAWGRRFIAHYVGVCAGMDAWAGRNGVAGERRSLIPGALDAGAQLTRWTEPEYADGRSTLAGPDRPSARAISQLVSREHQALPNAVGASSFLWQWGQFLDHDLDLTAAGDEPADIAVPQGDGHFDPAGKGGAVIPFFRSIYDPATGHRPDQPRQQINLVTSYIDASNVYGSDPVRAAALRTRDGTGRLRTSGGKLLPFNVDGLLNGGGSSPNLFLAGDVRANEQIGLTAMHVLFVREHNRWAALLKVLNPSWPEERIFQQARILIGAEMQAITYREFLPLLLGEDALPAYSGYRQEVDPSISNIFSTVAFRLGHSLLNPRLLRLGPDGQSVPDGPLDLQNAFFRPDLLSQPGALEELLRGLAAQRARALDPFVTDGVRNFLFGAPGSGGFDLAALNIQRGRDHGIPHYNSCRVKLGLAPKVSFAAISSDPETQVRLEQAYGTIESIDAWVGGLAEDRVPGALVGELFYVVLRKQFLNLRDGDPFWYERVLDAGTQGLIERLTLRRVIQLNTEVENELAEDVFRAPASAPY